jgi:hypothetical protein
MVSLGIVFDAFHGIFTMSDLVLYFVCSALLRCRHGSWVGTCSLCSLDGGLGLLCNDLVIVIALVVRRIDCRDGFVSWGNRRVRQYVSIGPYVCLGGRLIDLEELLELWVLREFGFLAFALQSILLERCNVFVVPRGALLKALLPSRFGKLFVGYLLILRSRSRHPCRQHMLTGRAISA